MAKRVSRLGAITAGIAALVALPLAAANASGQQQGQPARQSCSLTAEASTPHIAGSYSDAITLFDRQLALTCKDEDGVGIDIRVESSRDDPGYNGGAEYATMAATGMHAGDVSLTPRLRFERKEGPDGERELLTEASLRAHAPDVWGSRDLTGVVACDTTGFCVTRGISQGKYVDVRAGVKSFPGKEGEERSYALDAGVGVHDTQGRWGLWGGTSTKDTYGLAGVANVPVGERTLGAFGAVKYDPKAESRTVLAQGSLGRPGDDMSFYSHGLGSATDAVLGDTTVPPMRTNLDTYLANGGKVAAQLVHVHGADKSYVEAQAGGTVHEGDRFTFAAGGGYAHARRGDVQGFAGEALLRVKEPLGVSGARLDLIGRVGEGRGAQANVIFTYTK